MTFDKIEDGDLAGGGFAFSGRFTNFPVVVVVVVVVIFVIIIIIIIITVGLGSIINRSGDVT